LTHSRSTSTPGRESTRARAAIIAWSMTSGIVCSAPGLNWKRPCMSEIRSLLSGWLRR
jgi:hypothetical protein